MHWIPVGASVRLTVDGQTADMTREINNDAQAGNLGKVLPDVAGFYAFVARLCATFVAPFAPLLSRPFRAGFA